MTKAIDTPILPRPVEALPDYAAVAARKACADKVAEAFGLSRASSMAIANAVVDPASVRKGIGEPSDPNYERIAVPGGVLQGIRTTVWGRRAMPDPRNPRTLPARKHPFAVDPGTGKEDSKFRPIPEPRTPKGVRPITAELAVDVENRHHLTWASEQAKGFVIANNDWRPSIRTQGVMEAVWMVPTTYRHADGTEPVTVLTSAEGSSRMTADHDILGIRSSDVPYDEGDAKFRAHLKRLNELLRSGEAKADDLAIMRCERVPALIIVGFVPYENGLTGFPTALKSLVALRHVDPPQPWGEGPENESLADEVLDELERRNLITPSEAAYYAGSITRDEASAARLSPDPTNRAAEIVRLLTSQDQQVRDAIRVAVTSQSTRKNVNQGLVNALSTALILRAVSDDPGRIDQARRYFRKAFGKAVHSGEWAVTGRDVPTLVADAMAEVRDTIATNRPEEIGVSTLELAARSAFPLIVAGRLSGDRGTAGNEQPDRRSPGDVIDAMRQDLKGVRQLGQALLDHAAGRPIRIVDEEGAPVLDAEGAEKVINDTFLRGEFPPPGKSKAHRPGDTPGDRLHNAKVGLATAMEAVAAAFEAVSKVVGDDGLPLVDATGVDGRDCRAWRDQIRDMEEEFVVWSRTFRRVNGVDTGRGHEAPTVRDEPDEDGQDAVYEERDAAE